MRKVPGGLRGSGVDRTAGLLLVAILATGILPAPATADSSAAVTEAARLQTTILALRDHLYATQDRANGSWEPTATWVEKETSWMGPSHEFGGRTALATYALLVSGESRQHEPVAAAIAFLRRCRMTGTYAVAMRAHVWAHLTGESESLQRDAAWLLKAGVGGLFHYDPLLRSAGTYDHSCTQYGFLGLWEASKRGVRVPRSFWETGASHFVRSQSGDGGWMYGPSESVTTGSMTCAGMTCLLVARQFDPDGRLSPAGTAALNRGLAWLDARYTGASNPPRGDWTYYYLYGIERVSLACGIRYLNRRDWFNDGFEHIRGAMSPSGDLFGHPWRVSFALLFLARGQYPVWMNRLQLPGAEREAAPNDVARLTRYVSDTIERELNWQVVSPLDSPELWLNVPITTIIIPSDMTLTDAHRATLRRYVALGGLLLAIPKTPGAAGSARQLGRELFPDAETSRLPRDHALYTLALQPQAHLATLTALSNGARFLMLIAGDNWQRHYREDSPDRRAAPWQIAANLYAYVTDMGRLGGRYDTPWRPVDKPPGRRIPVIRVRYDGRWNHEPALWDMMAGELAARHDVAVDLVDLPLAELDSHAAHGRFVHLAGVDPVVLPDAQIAAITRYARNGGTVLVETVGGQGGFARSIEYQIADHLRRAAVQLDRRSTVLSGQGLPGAYDLAEVGYRHRAVTLLGLRRRSRLASFRFARRDAIFISREDLTLGALGVRHWEIIGYDRPSARRVLINLLLYSAADPGR